MRILAFVAVAASALALTGAAHAAPISGLYNTGVTDTGAQAPNGVDSHWTLDGGSAFISGVQGTFPLNGPWLDENTDTASRWITPTSTAGDSVDPRNAGFYQYSLTFDLTAAQASDASFLGQFAADNGIQWIKLNGTAILGSDSGSAIGGFSSWTNFAASSDFQAGANTLTFDVVNFGQASGNPSGLRVEFLSSNEGNAVPEPASWALMIGGFGLTGAALRRQRRLAVAVAA